MWTSVGTSLDSPHPHQQDRVEMVKNLKFLGVHISKELKWSNHTDAVVKKAQNAEEIWPVPEGTHSLLQESHREHTVRLHHSLVQQLHRCGPQGSSEGDTCSQTHHWMHTACPKGHLQHHVSQEGQKIIRDPSNPSHALFTPLQSLRCPVQGHHGKTERLANSYH